MRQIVNVFAVVAMITTVLVIGQYYGGLITGSFDGPQGMAIVGLQLLGLIAAASALLFGFVGRIMDRRVPLPAGRIANTSIAVGLLGGLLLFASPFVFG